jgi:hypothetical protein
VSLRIGLVWQMLHHPLRKSIILNLLLGSLLEEVL